MIGNQLFRKNIKIKDAGIGECYVVFAQGTQKCPKSILPVSFLPWEVEINLREMHT